MIFVVFKFTANLLQHHEICNRKFLLLTRMGGTVLIINMIHVHLLTWSNKKPYLGRDNFLRKSAKSEDAIPNFLKIRFLKTRIPALL